MARDPEMIQRDIEKHRDALGESVDALVDRTHPRNVVESSKAQIAEKLDDPRIRYSLIAIGALVGIVVLRVVLR